MAPQFTDAQLTFSTTTRLMPADNDKENEEGFIPRPVVRKSLAPQRKQLTKQEEIGKATFFEFRLIRVSIRIFNTGSDRPHDRKLAKYESYLTLGGSEIRPNLLNSFLYRVVIQIFRVSSFMQFLGRPRNLHRLSQLANFRLKSSL